MTAVEVWCRVTVVGPDGAVLACCLLRRTGAPDLGSVDRVARLALLAGRLGGGIVLADVSSALRELLDLAGLSVQVAGEAERREEPLGVEGGQEEIHPGDLHPGDL
jgi:hypothetical protein